MKMWYWLLIGVGAILLLKKDTVLAAVLTQEQKNVAIAEDISKKYTAKLGMAVGYQFSTDKAGAEPVIRMLQATTGSIIAEGTPSQLLSAL